MPPLQITGLNIFPIKGCRGIPLDTVEVDRIGLAGDRRLMVVDSDNRFISQRESPVLATIVPTLGGDALGVTAPGHGSLRLQLDPNGPTRTVTVWWEHGIAAADQGDAAAEWFSDVLSSPCRLVAFGPEARNPIDPKFSPRAEAQTAFTDGYPLTVALEESLDALNRRLVRPVTMGRFRPSVVVGGGTAWCEDDWRAIRLGSLMADVVKPCARCVVTTTDQMSGYKDPDQEPLRTLASFRVLRPFGAIFAQNVVPRDVGVLNVGDLVEVL